MAAARMHAPVSSAQFINGLCNEADAIFLEASLVVVGASALNGVMLVWTIYGEDVIDYFGNWTFWLSALSCIALNICLLGLISKLLMPRFVDHIQHVLVEQGLLLDVLSDDAHVRFPHLGGRLARSRMPTLRFGRSPSAESAGSFRRHMREFLLAYTHCCKRRQIRPWPVWWPASLISGGCALSMLTVMLGATCIYCQVTRSLYRLNEVLEYLDGARGVGLFYLGVFVPICIVALIAVLQDCAKRRGLAAALR